RRDTMYGWRSTGPKALFFSCLSVVYLLYPPGSISVRSSAPPRVRIASSVQNCADDPLRWKSLSANPCTLEAVRTQVKELPKLKAGRPIERELAGDATHSYRIKLREGEFLRVEIEQRGIDVIASLVDPDNKQIVVINNSKENRETETVLA